MSKVYYGVSGSDANEMQIKLVLYYQNILGNESKKKIIARAMPKSDILGFDSPLNITKKEVDDIVTITTKLLNSLVDQLTKEYSWNN